MLRTFIPSSAINTENKFFKEIIKYVNDDTFSIVFFNPESLYKTGCILIKKGNDRIMPNNDIIYFNLPHDNVHIIMGGLIKKELVFSDWNNQNFDYSSEWVNDNPNDIKKNYSERHYKLLPKGKMAINARE